MVNNNNNAPSSDPAPAFNSFPIVKAVDIVSSLSQELNIQVTLDEITKPNFNVASRCFQAFLDYLSGISVKDIEANKNAVQGTMIYKVSRERAKEREGVVDRGRGQTLDGNSQQRLPEVNRGIAIDFLMI